SLQIGYRYRGLDPWSVELDQRIRLPEELSLRKELRLCTFRSHKSIYAFQAAPLPSFLFRQPDQYIVLKLPISGRISQPLPSGSKQEWQDSTTMPKLIRLA